MLQPFCFKCRFTVGSVITDINNSHIWMFGLKMSHFWVWGRPHEFWGLLVSHYVLQWRGSTIIYRSLLYVCGNLHTAVSVKAVINSDKQTSVFVSSSVTHCRSWVWICVCSRSRGTVSARRRLWLWRSTPRAGQRSPETRRIRSVWWSCTDSHASIAPAHCRSPPHPRICRKTTENTSSLLTIPSSLPVLDQTILIDGWLRALLVLFKMNVFSICVKRFGLVCGGRYIFEQKSKQKPQDLIFLH